MSDPTDSACEVGDSRLRSVEFSGKSSASCLTGGGWNPLTAKHLWDVLNLKSILKVSEKNCISKFAGEKSSIF